MSRLTLKAVNKALEALGAKEVLVQGDGYFYFFGGNAARWPDSSVCVARLNHLTLEQWAAEWKALKNAYEAQR